MTTYPANSWTDGDVITAAKLNNLESGAASAYDRNNHTGQQSVDSITGLAPVATSGAYGDLSGAPALAPVATSGAYADLTGRPSISVVGQSGSYTDLTSKPTLPTVQAGSNVTVVQSGSVYTVSASTSASGSGTGIPGGVALDSFQTGSLSDDQLLDAALSSVAADTYRRTILLTNRLYTFSTANRAAFSAMKIAGPGGYGNADKGAAYMPCQVKLTMAGAWFTNGGADVFDVSLRNLAFVGGSGANVLSQSGAGSWWRPHLRDITASGLKSVLGTVSQAILMTGAHLDGFWEINNSYNTAFHLSGSDNRLFTNGGFFDSDPSFNTAGSATGQAIMWFDSLENTSIGPVYITAESLWTGIKISGAAYGGTGSNQGGPLNIWGAQIEGRNAGQGSNGALVRMDGGIARFRDCGFHYGMVSPSTPGRAPADAGIIHHAGGQLIVSGATYDRATGVAQTVPLVYTASTGKCIVDGVQPQFRGGTWSGLPVVGLKSGNAENRITDATVTLATI